MSDIQLPGAEATLTVNTSQFERGISRAQQVLTGLEPIVATQWWGLQNLSRAFGAVGSAVAAGFGVAVREAVAWESAMVGVQRTTGATPDQLSEIEAGLRKVANVTPIAVSELANLAEQAGALGVANTDIPEFVRIMGNLIASTNLTTASVEDLARTMNVLGVPVEAFERFASTLLNVGRNTAATETEILNMARRLAPMARVAGFTADQVLGLSAAVISLGPRAEAGSSAITRVIRDVSDAVATGSDDLNNWAQVAGMTAEQFAQAWRTDASGALEQIIVGLGKFQGNIVGLSGVLRNLDQTNVRNLITLGALANGIVDVNNEQTSLIAINNLSEQSWRQNSAMQEVAAARAKTFASQVIILRNRLAEMGNTIGSAVLPWLGRLLGFIQDLAAGFGALPGPLKFALGAIVAVVGAVSLLAGGLLALVGPLVLILSSWRALSKVFADSRNAALGIAGAEEALTGVVNAQTGAVARNTGVWIQNRNAQGQFAKGGTRVASATGATANATAALGAAAPLAATGVSKLWSGLSRLSRIAAIVGAVLSLATVAMTLFGHQVRKSADDVEEKIKQDEQLVDALEQVRKGNIQAADSYLLQKVAAAGLLDATERLHVSYAGIIQIIKGSAPPKFAADTVKQLKDAADAGDKGAQKILEFLAVQRGVYKESARAAGILDKARSDLGQTNADTADTEAALAEKTDETRKAQEKANEAAISYVDAVFSHQRAVLATKDAQEEYQKALSESADPTERLAKAENDLASARNDHRNALRDLAKAEAKVLTARQDQIDELADAEADLADQNDRYLDSIDKIHDLEQQIADLRSGVSSKDLLEATNKLANAHLRLREAEQGVEDAEWQLAYLRGEGASVRAIEDAEFALDKARQEVADETENVIGSEDDLRKLRESPGEEIIRLERELAAARRDSDSALRGIRNQEEDVRQLRNDIANDTAYLDAQADVADAQSKIFDNLQKIRDAELELQRIRLGGLQDEITKAQLDLEEALWAQARAATAVQKEQAAMRKEFWDSGKEAHVLADNLSLLLDKAPTEESRRKLLEHIALLRRAVVVPEEKKAGAPSGGGNLPTVGADTPGLKIPDPKPADGKSFAEKLRGAIETAFSLIVGYLAQRLFVKLLVALGVAAVGLTGGLAIVAGIIVGLLVSYLLDKFLKSDLGKKLIDGLIHGLTVAADAIGRFFHSLWFDFIWPGLQDAFGLGSPSKKMAEVGGWLMEGLLGGLGEGLLSLLLWFVNLPVVVLEKFADAGLWLFEKGRNVIGGLWNGIVDKWNALWEWLGRVGGWIGDKFSDAWNWLTTSGRNIIGGLWNGVAEKFNDFTGWLGDIGGKIARAFNLDWLYDTFVVGGKNIVIGLWNGLVDRAGWLFDKVSNFAHDIFDTVKEGLGKLWPGSPSQAGIDIGVGLGLGFKKGLKEVAPELTRSAALMASQLEKTMQVDPRILEQFDNARFSETLARQTANLPGFIAPQQVAPTQEGDHIEITGADERSALDIAEEVMFKKLVRTRGN